MRPTVVDMRRANRVLEEGEREPTHSHYPSSSSSSCWTWWVLVVLLLVVILKNNQTCISFIRSLSSFFLTV